MNHHPSKILLISFLVFSAIIARAQSEFKGLENLFTVPQNYVVYHIPAPPVIDGNINELVWRQVNWTKDFADIEGADKPQPPLGTRVKLLWDDSCLYIAAQLTEPHIWAKLKDHDDVIFHDNDFELFIDPHNTTQPYFEVEVNALNTIFDLLLNKPYRNGGVPVINWDVQSLRSAVKMQGTLNDPTDKDEGWTVEMAIPFKSISLGERRGLPQEGTTWRINFSRVEWDTKIQNGNYVLLTDDKGKLLPEHNWVWSPQGLINMHYPERWGYVQFSRQAINSVTFNLPYAEQQKQYLWLIYYKQKQWHKNHQEYAASLGQLGIGGQISIGKKENTLQLEATKHQFMALIADNENKITWSIDQDGLVHQLIVNPNE